MLKKERYIESNKRVEAAGVEPASDNKRRKASTRVVCLFFLVYNDPTNRSITDKAC